MADVGIVDGQILESHVRSVPRDEFIHGIVHLEEYLQYRYDQGKGEYIEYGGENVEYHRSDQI